jgi:translation initiation factor IF-1
MALLLLSGFGLASPAGADQWSRTYALSGKADLWMSTGDGNVRIEVWDRKEIEARLDTVGYTINEDFTLIEKQTGDRVEIEARFPAIRWGIGLGRRSLDFVVKIPREAKLDISTGDGHLRVASVTGEMRLHTGDGGIEATGLDGRLVASSGDGRISVTGRFDQLDIHTGDGSVEAAALPGSAIAEPWNVRTGDGNVTVRLPDGFKANLSADTGDGTVTMNVPVAMSGRLSGSHVRGSLNGGGGSLTVRTGDGSIRFERY